MTDPKTKRERAIHVVARAICCPSGECGGATFETGCNCDFYLVAACAAIDAYKRVIAEDTITSPLTDESTGGPEGSGPGWEP